MKFCLWFQFFTQKSSDARSRGDVTMNLSAGEAGVALGPPWVTLMEEDR